MKVDHFLQKSSNIFAQNRLLKFVVIIQAVTIIICMFMANRALDYQRTVIIPPGADTNIVVTGTTVNDEYIRHYTRYIMSLLLDYQPNTIKSNVQDILKLSTSKFYPEFQKSLLAMVEQTKTLNVSSVYYPETIDIDQETKTIKVRGLHRLHTYSAPVENAVKEYVIRYAIIHGRFYIDEIGQEINQNS